MDKYFKQLLQLGLSGYNVKEVQGLGAFSTLNILADQQQ